MTCESDILRKTYWFILTLPRSSSKVKVLGQSSRLQAENVYKVVGATSSEGLLMDAMKVTYTPLLRGLLH